MSSQPCSANIIASFANRPAAIQATTYLQKWDTNSRPVALLANGGNRYVVKALQAARVDMGRVLVNEQVIARVGRLIGAAVPNVDLIDVPIELINSQPEMAHMSPGVAHGSQVIENVTERMLYEHAALPENRPRFTILAVLFGLVGAQDYQFVYEKTAPNLVYSVDHGFFFPGGPSWTEASLAGAAAANYDIQLTQQCNATEDDIRSAIDSLSAIDDAALTHIVAVPPDAWGLSMEERLAMLNFLIRRRDELSNLF